MQKSNVVVIGGVAAGPKSAATLMRRLLDAKVTLFQKDQLLSYSSCGLPYFASGEVNSFNELTFTGYGVSRDSDFFRNSRRFEAVTGALVTKIDRERKCVQVRMIETGEEFEHGYDKLVIATGAYSPPPPFPIPNSDRVRAFHVPDDSTAFRSLAEQNKIDHAVIIGAGFVGCEMAEAIGSLWGIQTTLIEKEPHVLPLMLDSEMAMLVEAHLREQDVSVITGTTVEGIELDDAGKPCASLAGRESINCDYVVLALGVRPEVSLARECGLTIGQTGAIAVNARMQTSDPDIYAGGDCVESVQKLTGQPVNLCLGSIANRQGRVIAENLAGKSVEFPPVLGTQVLRVFELNVGAVGLSEKAAQDAGLSVETVWAPFSDKPDYQPDVKNLRIKMVYEPHTHRLLGLQAVGQGDICRRIDVFATFLQHNGAVADLFDLEHGYAPPYAEALDPLHHLAAIAEAQERGVTFIRPHTNLAVTQNGGSVLLDVREEEESTNTPIPREFLDFGFPVCQIPLNELPNRCGELPKNARIIIICQRGARSYQAAMTLKSKSFENVVIVAGGLQTASY